MGGSRFVGCGGGWGGGGVVAVMGAAVFTSVIDEVFGHLLEGHQQRLLKRLVMHLFGQRHAHAQQPFIARSRADGVRRVAHAQARVPPVLHEQLRAAQPARQEFEQALLAACEAFRVHLADAPGLGQFVHQLVETVCELLQRSGTPQFFVRGGGHGGGRGGHGRWASRWRSSRTADNAPKPAPTTVMRAGCVVFMAGDSQNK